MRIGGMTERITFRDRVADVFRANANEWLHWTHLARVGGQLAWRTRISDCRLELGMAIENKITRSNDNVKHSWYRYNGVRTPTHT
jgi:hypothetical protein